MRAQAQTSTSAPTRRYRWTMPAGWWLRKRHYFLYIVREFTAVPMALWLLWLLVEIKRAGAGPAVYSPSGSTAFVVFSAICLVFAMYHSFTFLKLAGVIIRLKVLDHTVPPRVIVFAMFGAWALASIVIGAVLIGFGR